MKLFSLFSFIVALNNLEKRILYGKISTANYPLLISIFQLLENNGILYESHICAGVLIKSDIVLTAAHCDIVVGHSFVKTNVKNIFKNTFKNEKKHRLYEEIEILGIIKHPFFDPITYLNDSITFLTISCHN